MITKLNTRRMIVPCLGAVFLFFSCSSIPPGRTAPEQKESPKESTSLPAETVPEQPPSAPPENAMDALESYTGIKNAEEAIEILREANVLEMDVESRLVYAALLRVAGDPAESREPLESVLKEDPENAEALFGLALLEGQLGNEIPRDKALEASLKADPENPDAWVYKGALEAKKKKWVPAGTAYRKALKFDENHADALSGLAWALAKLDKEEEALEYMDRAVEAAPGYAYPLVDRSRLLVVLSRQGDAEKDLTAAIALEPEVPWHYLDRARIRLKYFKDFPGALADLEKAESLNPQNFFTKVYLAGLHEEERRFSESLRYYRQVLKLREDYFWAYPSMGKLEWIAGNYSAAAHWFTKAAKEDDQEFSYSLLAAVSHLKSGKTREGQKQLKEILRGLDKDSAKYNVVRFGIEKGIDSFAVNFLAKETDKSLQSRLWFYMGVFYGLEGNLESEKIAYKKITDKIGELEYDMAYAAINGDRE